LPSVRALEWQGSSTGSLLHFRRGLFAARLNSLSAAIATIVEQAVANMMGPIISVGEADPCVERKAIIVVGITVKLEDVIAHKGAHSIRRALSLWGFNA